MTKQCKALELCDELYVAWAGRMPQALGNRLEKLQAAIQDLITEHEAALAKAAGDWIDVADADPGDYGTYEVQLSDGSVDWFTYSPDSSWPVLASKLTIVRWFRPADAPPPPPIVQPEPEIEIPPLISSDNSHYQASVQMAHEAAMRPVLKELAELRAALNRA